MVFVDANYFLRALTEPVTPEDRTMARAAERLFRAIAAGQVEATTSDAVIAEVAFILASPRNYDLSPAEVAARLKPLLLLRNFRLPQKRVLMRALDIWSSAPRLGFVDALSAAYAQQPDVELATFDADFDRIPDVTRYLPEEDGDIPQ